MPTLKIAAVQYDIQWLDKKANFDHLEIMLREFFLDNSAVDLLLLPETFSTGFCTQDTSVQQQEGGGEDLIWLKRIANEYNCFVAGTVFVKQGDKKANRFYWVSADGSVEYYDKRHLFRLGNEDKYVVQGKQRKIFEIKGVKVLPQVCYDLRFPVWSRNKQDYDLIVNVANWPGIRRNIWDTLLKARAIENQAYVIGVNRVGKDGQGFDHSGGTIFVDFAGNSLVMAKNDKQQVISYELDFSVLDKFKKDFPAYLDADEFEIR